MATIIKRLEGTYRVQIRRKGQRALSATFAKRQDAADWAKKTEAALIEHRFFPEREKHTLTEAIARYNREILPRYTVGTAVKKQQVLKWWDKRLGRVYLSAITSLEITEALQETGFAPATMNAYYAHLFSVFTIAIHRWNWMQLSPRIDRFHVGRQRMRVLKKEEKDRLLAECKRSKSAHLYTVVVLALSTGARYREILRLRWEDVDFERGMITFWKTKNRRVRSIPLASTARLVLEEHHVEWGKSDWIFPGPKKVGQSTLWRAWDLARKRARLSDFRFHDLRHTFASNLAVSGASLFDIGELLGHEKLDSTLIYTHLTEGHTRKVLEKMIGEHL